MLALLCVSYTLIVGGLAIRRHRGFGSGAYDLGIYDQALWLISRGYPALDTVRGLPILGDHCTPILYPLALLYRLGGGTASLLWFQTAALALGAVPLYRLACRQSGSLGLGLLASGLYLLYPPLRAVGLADFHPVALATPGVLFALDFAAERRAVPFAAACFWMALCRQEVALVTACLGGWYAVRWRQPRALLICVTGLLWFFGALRLQAHLAGTRESAYAELYSQFGPDSVAILRTFALTPWVPLRAACTAEAARYLLALLLPLALLPLRAPGILWLLLAPLGLNLLSNRPIMRGLDWQYTALLTPVLFAAGAAAVALLPQGGRRRITAGAWAVCAGVTAMNQVPAAQFAALYPPLSAAQAAVTRHVLGTIPAGASVSATQNLVPHLAHRRSVYLFPNPFWPLATGPSRRALRQEFGKSHPAWDRTRFERELSASRVQYLALGYGLGAHVGFYPLLPREETPMLIATLLNPSYGVVAAEAGVWVLKRGAEHQAGLRRTGLGLCESAPKSRWASALRLKLSRAARG